jgi:glycosyltransferase involved in cell wall biosynthesis
MKPASSLKVGFVGARGAWRKGDEVWIQSGVGRVLDRMGERFGELHVALSEWAQPEPMQDHLLKLKRGEFLSLPYLPSFLGGIGKGRACKKVIREVERRSDVVVVQLPFAAPTALLRARKPRVYHLCADVLEVARTTPYYAGYKRPAALAAAASIDWLYKQLVARPDSHVVSNGEELFERYHAVPSRGRSVVSATLAEREIMSIPRARDTRKPLRILYVGYLRHEKGVATLLKAFEQLIDAEPGGYELSIIGAQNAEDRGISEDLRGTVRAIQQKATLTLTGALPFGPKLFQHFADADVLVLPSLSEGTPRVLIEARAFGCAVVASRVGGVPLSVDDGVDGIMFPPRDTAALVDALRRIAHDDALWKRLSAAGIERARRTTVEAFADSISDEVERAAAGSRV